MRTVENTHKDILIFSLISSFLAAFIYLFVSWCFLPSTDMAKQGGFWLWLDPFVLTAVIPVATIIGTLGSLFAIILLRDRKLWLCGVFILCCVTALYVYTQGHLGCALLGAPLVSLAAAMICRFVPLFAISSGS